MRMALIQVNRNRVQHLTRLNYGREMTPAELDKYYNIVNATAARAIKIVMAGPDDCPGCGSGEIGHDDHMTYTCNNCGYVWNTGTPGRS